MTAPVVGTHPVTFPIGNTGADNISTALSIVKIAGIAVRNEDDTAAEEVLKALYDLLDLAERFLVAGAAWARDADNAITGMQHANLRAAMDAVAKMKRP